MIKIKKNTSRNSVYFIVVSVLAILGITLASALSIKKSTDVNVYPVILSTDVDFVEDLQDVVNGDTIVNNVTLERATDSKDIFRIVYPVTEIGQYAFTNKYTLMGVKIPNVITTIGSRAFQLCYSLTNITIPSSVVNIGDYAFYECTGLDSITMEGVTNIGIFAFAWCTGVTGITLPITLISIL